MPQPRKTPKLRLPNPETLQLQQNEGEKLLANLEKAADVLEQPANPPAAPPQKAPRKRKADAPEPPAAAPAAPKPPVEEVKEPWHLEDPRRNEPYHVQLPAWLRRKMDFTVRRAEPEGGAYKDHRDLLIRVLGGYCDQVITAAGKKP